MSAIYCALVHHPVRDRDGQVATSAVTNIDVHDIARSAFTFGLCGMFVVSPIDAQRELVVRILEHWRLGAGKRRMPHRSEALAICSASESIAHALQSIEAREGRPAKVVATAARSDLSIATSSFAALSQRMSDDPGPWLLLFGTGHGLTDDVLQAADVLLEPIRGAGQYNHLSVRAAAAIVFARLFAPAGQENQL